MAHDGLTRGPDSGSSEDTTALLSAPGPAVPARIGRYTIERLLGQGGQGTVYLGRHRYLGVEAAIKVLLVPMSVPRRRAFLREARRLASLRGHPGIVEVREFGLYRPGPEQPAVPYLATDLVAGARPLTRFAQFAGLDLGARLALFARVCDAVGHAHAMGIIHLDLKPGNILVVPGEGGRPPQPKIIDFGLARAADPAEELGHPAPEGTLPYMSPEQATPGASLDPRSDVYSLGVILYELVTGTRPYSMPEDHASALRVVQDAAPDLRAPAAAALPGPVRHMIERSMAKAPAARYADAGALCEDFRAYLAGLAPPGLRQGFWRRMRLRMGGFCARRPRAAGAAAVVLSTLLTAYVGVWLLHLTRVTDWFERTLTAPIVTGEQLNDVLLVSRTKMSEPTGHEVYGKLLTKMAEAPPLAVGMDFYGMGDSDAKIPALVSGIEALKRVNCPVVVGVTSADSDGKKPLDCVLRPEIRKAAAAWGDLGVYMGDRVPWKISLLHLWPHQIPYPSLSLAVVAVAHRARLIEQARADNPSQPAEFGIEYEAGSSTLHVHFVPAAEHLAIQPSYDRKDDCTLVMSLTRTPPDPQHPVRSVGGDAETADVAVRMPPSAVFEHSTLSIDQVMADPRLCSGKIVLLFDLMDTKDVHDSSRGRVRGAYAHAIMMDSLWSHRTTRRPDPLGQWLICSGGAAAGLLLALPIVGRRSWWPRWAIWGMVVGRGLLLAGGLAAGVVAAWSFDYLFNPLIVVFAMLATALLLVAADRLRRQYPALLESPRSAAVQVPTSR